MPKVFAALIALLPLVACTAEAPPAPNDAGVLALGIQNAVVVEPHLVSTGAFTPEQFAKLPALGYRTVIQLRPATEEGSGWEELEAEKVGIELVRIPVPGAEGLTEENARRLDAALRKHPPGGVLVACASGNRVGGLLALKAHFCDGAAPEQALAAGKKAGLGKAEPAVRKALGLPEAK